MNARLEIPTITGNKIFELEATTQDPGSHYGQPVLFVAMHEEHPSSFLSSDRGREFSRLWPEDQYILDGATFRLIHQTINAVVVTNDPDSVCRALGVPSGEPGIIEEN